MFSLFPKNTEFGPKFHKSVQVVHEMAKIFEKTAEKDAKLKSLRHEAQQLEEKGDMIIKDIIVSLNDSFITPYDREDMYALADKLDDVGDEIFRLIQHIDMYALRDVGKYISPFATLYHEMAQTLAEAIQCLFAKKVDQEKISRLLQLLGSEAQKWREFYEKTIIKIFRDENDAKEIIKWGNIIREMELVIDNFKKVARTIEGIIMKVG